MDMIHYPVPQPNTQSHADFFDDPEIRDWYAWIE